MLGPYPCCGQWLVVIVCHCFVSQGLLLSGADKVASYFDMLSCCVLFATIGHQDALANCIQKCIHAILAETSQKLHLSRNQLISESGVARTMGYCMVIFLHLLVVSWDTFMLL